MIYQPTDGQIMDRIIKCRPKTCFIMTQLDIPVPDIVTDIRKILTNLMRRHGIRLLDANDEVTGRDFLLKIWEMILSVPMGIAIVDREMKSTAIQNVYYEIGVMQAYGKETLVVRTPETKVPSDFVRTEYVNFDEGFKPKIRKFIKRCKEQADFFLVTAQNLKVNPPLAFDYYRRAYLMSGERQAQQEATQILATSSNPPHCESCNALESSWIKT